MLAATIGVMVASAFLLSARELASFSYVIRRYADNDFSPWGELRNLPIPTWIDWGGIAAIAVTFIVLGLTLRTRPRRPRSGLAGAIVTMACLIAWYGTTLLYAIVYPSSFVIPLGIVQALSLLGTITGIVLLFVGALRRAPR